MELYGLKQVSPTDLSIYEVERYTLEKPIHVGKANIRILKAFSQKDNSTVAIKLFPKQKDGKCMPNFFNEERSASLVSHAHILKYHAFYKDALIQLGENQFKEYSAIVMEFIPFGDLFGLVSQRPFSEKLARTIFRQIILAITHLHSQDLAHLDLKLENILIDPKDGAKLIDFDSCEIINRDKKVLHRGSPGYRAPELSREVVDDLLLADIYSLGVMLFTLVMGAPPYNEVEKDGKFYQDKYYGALRKDVKRFWKEHENHRERDGRAPLTSSCKEIISAMLSEDPNRRPRIEELQKMKWIQGEIYTKTELANKLLGFFQH